MTSGPRPETDPTGRNTCMRHRPIRAVPAIRHPMKNACSLLETVRPLPRISTGLYLATLATFGLPSFALADPLPKTESEATRAGSSSRALRVGISPFVPFVIPGDKPTGYSIELWHHIAQQLERPTEFVMATGVADKLRQLEAGKVDVAIGGLTMTPERERAIDFTHPSLTAGLAILMRADEVTSSLWRLVWGGLGKTNLGVVFAFVALVIIAGHLVWLAERGKDMFDDRYLPGVFEGIYWAVVTASTVGYGDKAPVKWAGRTLAIIVIVISLPMFALFTAELASAFTAHRIAADIDGPDDLQGRRVGIVRGTASAIYAEQLGLTTQQWDRADDAYAALESKRVDAVLYDAPSLHYYSRTAGRGKVLVVSREFKPQNLSMAIADGSDLREGINRALLEIAESGVLTDLKMKWFGSAD